MSVLRMAARGRAVEPPTESLLLGLANTALDAMFRASPAGPVPDGNLRGTAVLFPGSRIAKPLAAMTYAFWWQGKVVDADRGVLKNKITPLHIRAIKALVSRDYSWVDNGPCILLDYSKTSFVARMVRDEIRLVGPGLYLGVVWLWRRRVAWFLLRQPRRAR